MAKKIGLFGGTFDPPHLGHVIIADDVRYELQLDEVWFLPTNDPPHKQKAQSSKEHRATMLQLAIRNHDYFRMNTIEFEREGKSYTIDTVLTLKEQFPHVSFYFIIGADMVEYLPNWKDIDELIKLITFVGVGRQGYTIETSYPIKTVSVPIIEISSSDIKKRIEGGRPVQYLLDEKVLQYIKEYQLYGYREST